MKKYILSLALLALCAANSIAQNLLSNPSFRLRAECPDWDSQIDRCLDWYSVGYGTPDFFHDCAGDSAIVGVPENAFGYQESPSNSYVGVYTYNDGTAINVREYIGTTFPPLVVGQTYTVTMTVSLPEKLKFATKGLGVFFYIVSDMVPPTDFLLPKTPQIDYASYGVISDRTNWVQLTKTFVADSAYTHLAIGNFHADPYLDPIVVPSSMPMSFDCSYYYIDSVAVVGPTGPTTSVASINDRTRVVSVAPNPFTNTASLNFGHTEPTDCEVTLSDISGRVVRRYAAVTTTSLIIERGDLPAGVYFYKVSLDGTAYVGKMVIN